MCGNTEDRRHLFRCQNEQARDLREKGLNQLLQAIGDGTAQGFRQVFCTGLQTVLEWSAPDEHTQADWLTELQHAYNVQLGIGWEQVMYGRVANQWEVLAQYNTQQDHSIHNFRWTSKVIRLCWDLR